MHTPGLEPGLHSSESGNQRVLAIMPACTRLDSTRLENAGRPPCRQLDSTRLDSTTPAHLALDSTRLDSTRLDFLRRHLPETLSVASQKVKRLKLGLGDRPRGPGPRFARPRAPGPVT